MPRGIFLLIKPGPRRRIKLRRKAGINVL